MESLHKQSAIRDLGCITNAEVINQFVELKGRQVVDVGCGNLTFTRILVEAGAQVLAIDPDPVQASLNRAAEPNSSIEFFEASAENLPVKDRSVDGVFFSYSLHHVPAEIYPQVFNEVFRVLQPEGFLYVIEPVDCLFNDVMKLFHNEDRERAAAWHALEDLAIPAFRQSEIVAYHSMVEYESWDDFADQLAGKTFNSLYTEEDVRRPEVKEAFERLGGRDHRFESPKQVMVLKGLRV